MPPDLDRIAPARNGFTCIFGVAFYEQPTVDGINVLTIEMNDRAIVLAYKPSSWQDLRPSFGSTGDSMPDAVGKTQSTLIPLSTKSVRSRQVLLRRRRRYEPQPDRWKRTESLLPSFCLCVCRRGSVSFLLLLCRVSPRSLKAKLG